MRRRPPQRHPNADRYLSKEEKLAQVICAALNDAGCVCERSPSTCSKMVWAARRALKHLGIEEGQ